MPDLAQMGPGREPTETVEFLLWESKTSNWEWIIGLIVFASAVYWIWRGKKWI